MASKNVNGRSQLAIDAAAATTLFELASLLRQLRRRDARARRSAELTYRELSERLGCSAASVGYYLSGEVLAPIKRFDDLVRLLGATAEEQAALARARDRIAEDRGSVAVASDAPGPPRTLPAPPTAFAGRRVELTELNTLVEAGTSVVVAVSGMGGVGKTALAVHWAHQAAKRFPDGQLYVNLRGFDPGEPLSVAEALGQLLAGLGLSPAELPRDGAGRADRYRSLLGGRRMLVLLDNAANAEQARALLPPEPCVAVVTSRNRLDGMATASGARAIALDTLAAEEALTLLHALIGERCRLEPEAARALTVLCGHLPLTLRVAAELAVARPAVSLGELVDELTAVSAADLSSLDIGDTRSDVRTVFSWSLRWLPDPARRAFVLFGLTPGDTVDALGLAAAAGWTPAEADRLLAALASAHLAQPAPGGRYAMHDLLRAYARELAEREFEPTARRVVTHRMLDYYLRSVTAAMETLHPGRIDRPRCYPASLHPSTTPDLSAVESASAWLAAERVAVVRLGVNAAGTGFAAHGIALAIVARLFFDSGYDQDGQAVHTAALAAVATLGEACHPADRANVLTALGIANLRLGRLDEGERLLAQAAADHHGAADPPGLVLTLNALGYSRRMQGRPHENLDCQRRGLELARAAGLRQLEGIQLLNLGVAHVYLDQHEQAEEFYRSAIAILAEWGHSQSMAHARLGLAAALAGLGRYSEALPHATDAFDIARSVGLLEVQVEANETLGSASRQLGRFAEAMAYLDDGLRLARQIGRRGLTANMLNTIGETHMAAGSPALARACHAEAVDLLEHDEDRQQTARSHLGLGDALAALGETLSARAHWERALHAYSAMGLPIAESLRDRLAALPES